ncbi:MAG: hypothetical protein SGILL_006340 [Bacillariaceae sp.]
MNSTLQCLSNTEEIRKYFLSGEYEKDLNRDNPLGTGGELATKFAQLLSEMWGVSRKRRNVMGGNNYSNSNYSGWSAVYPRDFKTTLGRHAEQFMGYDQHDSQEFATYLLDALHEDTNRVLKKPYIEKPEQEQDEPDDVAADKAWKIHLQREDSRVLENFMGQMKSRLECCTEGCDRVSTTFDPFMYLSVPVPGCTDKNIDLLFVPLDASKKRQRLTVTVSKMGKISDLLEKTNEKLVETGFLEKPLPLIDLYACDIWNLDFFKVFKVDDDVGGIQDRDKTVVYQLESLDNIRKTTQEEDKDTIQTWESKNTHRENLDVATMTQLNGNKKWLTTLTENYAKYSGGAAHQIGSKDIHVRMAYHQKLEDFLNDCYEVIRKEESGGLKRAREDAEEENSDDVKMEDTTDNAEAEPVIQGLVDHSDASDSFRNVRTKHDFAVLEFCANQLRKMIIEEMKKPAAGHQNGMIIKVAFNKKADYRTVGVAGPVALRVPCSTTVFDFRQLLAKRLSRSLNIVDSTDTVEGSSKDHEMSSGELTQEMTETSPGESATEACEKPPQPAQDDVPEPSDLLILRRAALVNKKGSYGSNRGRIGMVDPDDESSLRKAAVATDEAEQISMESLGNDLHVTVQWAEAYREKVFVAEEWDSEEPLEKPVEDTTSDDTKDAPLTVMDCITKYCEKEQLEESEMWYCNKCKNHVKAWKHCGLHRTPPYLIIHLKRFFFASSRRRDKISDFIDFPLEGLDLTEFVADYTEDTKPIYDCYAVSNHIGGLGGGHYTAYILNDESRSWSLYNDSSVTENVDPKDVVSADAYVLYYRRKDIPVNQDKEYHFAPSPLNSSTLICEQVDSPVDQRSVASGSDTAVADDLDATLDDVISNASTSPMGSVDNAAPQSDEEDLFADAEDPPENSSSFPLQ